MKDQEKKVHEALTEIGQLGSTQVIVLEMACPEENDDKPITEKGFIFVSDFLRDAEKLPQPPLLQDGIPKDDETFVIFWSSGTTGQPKGIEHPIRCFRYALAAIEKASPKTNSPLTWMITTCFFHAGGFGSFFQLLTYPVTLVFNHGADIDEIDTCEVLYKEIDKFKPTWLVFGSHHLVLMSQQKPKDKSLDLKSVLVCKIIFYKIDLVEQF